MSQALMVQLEAPVEQVAILGADPSDNAADHDRERKVAQKTARIEQRAEELEQEFASRKAQLEQSARALQAVGAELAKLRREMTEEMRTEAVELAMQIARKVLHQEIRSKGYEIDSIVAEALSRLPRRGEITVRLHPDDFELCSLRRRRSSDDETIRFTADPNVSPAGCLVTSAEGNVESNPETSLGQIDAALREDV